MEPRLNAMKAAPDAFKAVMGLETYVRGSVDKMLLHLLKLRASQINGCAFCIDLHVKEALADGEDPQKLHLLAVWRESPIYSEKERAVLAWTESLTRLPERGAPEPEYQSLREHFSEAEIVNLTVAIGVINVWNRWSVGFRSQHAVGMSK
jgi:AhpD family alkylhydroperoxidase